MAQNAIGRLFRGQSSSSLRQSVGSLTQKRSYSRNAIPTFTQTSSADLDAALNRFREELFIPFGLGTSQRRTIFRQKYADRLDEEPVTVPISDTENFTLRPMDPQSRPTNKEAVDVIAQMQTTQDWQNLLPFLSGLRMSHRRLNANRWEWVVRKAGQADALGIVLECAKQAERTNLRLTNAAFVKRLFFEIHRKAQVGEFQDPAVSKALALAQQFASLMEAPEHLVQDPATDPKRKPAVIGVLLELSAARALNVTGGKDETRDVRAYAQRLLGSWQAGNFSSEVKDWVNVDHMLQENVPIYNGMKLAMQVHGISNDRSIAPGLKTRINELGMLIANQKKLATEKAQQQPTIGLAQSRLLHQD
ncbi:hypothetical protein P170DRAFT_458172 [Aspergillus steynii IBT 23096]|uniref:Uncharacterized protein n=1 Tax=Aspergillus steynii IBT 23096 TaxID=1392250 RepID=A0A2I2FZB3_9EURO|nr:uncharacterized protein P170DRAFT_458172 [Aspergillus steynii IBT 23096]PLB45968.1 hypothetical protein P170DRAFT_458172 [Aspergillus steynii IBT 23096]